MRREKRKNYQEDMFRNKLENQIDLNHPLCKMSKKIKWEKLESEFAKHYCEDNGRPALPIRLMVSLEYLKQMEGISDEEVVRKWAENPYWQYFSGEEYFQTKYPSDDTSMVNFRKRIKESGLKLMFKESIELGLATKTIKKNSFKKVICDTTVQEKNIAYPTEPRNQNKIRKCLVKFSKKVGIKLRQTYERISPRAVIKALRYAHASQMKRARKAKRIVKNCLGRVIRDIERKWKKVKTEKKKKVKKEYEKLMKISKILFSQTRNSKNKIYSVHEPQVECIGKGKTHKPYEFGVKAEIGVTHKEGFAITVEALPGNPYDGHTLKNSLKNIEKNTGMMPEECYVDKGYKGHKVENVVVYTSGQRRGVTKRIKRDIKRRSMIEAMIGHMKTDGRLGTNYLHGKEGDKFNAILSGIGHNLRLISNSLSIA